MKKTKNKLVQIFLSLIAMSLPFLMTASSVQAADLDISCTENGGCSTNGANPLFSATTDEHFYPGQVITRTVNLENDSSNLRHMSLQPAHNSGDSLLESMMTLSIIDASNVILWSGSLADLYNTTSIDFGIFSANQNQNYQFSISLPQAADNDYANLNTDFDLSFTFTSDESENISTTGLVAGASNTTSSGSDTTPATYSCDDQSPGSAPVLLSAVAGANSVTLTWQEANDPLTYYLIAYGEGNNSEQYGNPNVGGSGTTSYIVSGLSGGQTYSFKVRAGNGCAAGNFSNVISATPTGIVIANAVAPGFEPGVLGEATEEEQSNEQKSTEENYNSQLEGQVAGAAIACTSQNMYLPWIIFAAQALLLIAWEFISRRNKSLIKNAVPVLITVLAVVLWYLLKQCGCYDVYLLSLLCKWGWLLSVAIALLIRIFGYLFLDES